MDRSALYVGVDGHKKGWVAVFLDDEGVVGAGCYEHFEALMASHGKRGTHGEARVIGVDMPLGLRADGVRHADAAAREFLKGRASSVFNAPARAVLSASSYEEAAAASQRESGKGLSKQSYHLLPKIREVDAFAKNQRVYEVHPEVSFQLMTGTKLAHSKKTWGGLQARLSALRKQGITLSRSLGEADGVPIDDVVDAAGAAWSARRISHGEAKAFPAKVQRASGTPKRRIAIWG